MVNVKFDNRNKGKYKEKSNPFYQRPHQFFLIHLQFLNRIFYDNPDGNKDQRMLCIHQAVHWNTYGFINKHGHGKKQFKAKCQISKHRIVLAEHFFHKHQAEYRHQIQAKKIHQRNHNSLTGKKLQQSGIYNDQYSCRQDKQA